MLDTMKRFAALVAMLALLSACGDDDSGPSVNRKAPEIIDFYVSPESADPGADIVLGWETSNANRVAIFERWTEGDDQVDLPLYESETVLSGFMQYRTHRTVDLVLMAYNTNSSADPVESSLTVTVAEDAARHIISFYPDPAYVQPGQPAIVKYILEDVGAGWTLEFGDVTNDDADPITRTFTDGGAFLTGEFTEADCSTDSILCIDGHTGFYAELFDAEGTSVDYKQTSVGRIAVSPPQVVQFVLEPEEITTGSSTTLTWDVRNAETVEILPGVGPQYCVDMVCSGSEVLTPTFTQSYTLTAVGPGGTMVASREITVSATPTPPTVDSFAVAPTEIHPGTSATLSWTTSLADSVDITAVPADAGLPTTFSVDGSVEVSPSETTTYTITATNTHGDDTATATLTVTALAAGDLVISEIMLDAETDPAGEWFELYNPGTMQVNLNGLTLDSGTGESMTVDTDLLLDGGAYALLAASSDTTDNDNLPTPDLVYTGLAFDIGGGGDELSVSDASLVIDAVSWTAAWTTTTGHSLSLITLDATDNDTFGNWCSAGTAWTGATSSYGSPGAAHDTCM